MKTLASLPLLLILSACTANGPLIALDAAVASTDAALAVLTSQGKIDPTAAATLIDAIASIPGEASSIIAEFESSDSAVVKADRVATMTQPIIARLSLLDPKYAPYVAATLAAWQAFLVSVQPEVSRISHLDGSTMVVPVVPRASVAMAQVKAKTRALNAHLAAVQK